MLMFKILGLLITGVATTFGAPFSSVRVKFLSPPYIHEHEVITNGGNTIAQNSFFSVGRLDSTFGDRLPGSFIQAKRNFPESFEPLSPTRVFFTPVEAKGLRFNTQHSGYNTPDFSNGLDIPDPLLLTGNAAILAVRYLYGRGELFYSDIPHGRSLLRQQEQRRTNGLRENILGSLNPSSPFYRETGRLK